MNRSWTDTFSRLHGSLQRFRSLFPGGSGGGAFHGAYMKPGVWAVSQWLAIGRFSSPVAQPANAGEEWGQTVNASLWRPIEAALPGRTYAAGIASGACSYFCRARTAAGVGVGNGDGLVWGRGNGGPFVLCRGVVREDRWEATVEDREISGADEEFFCLKRY